MRPVLALLLFILFVFVGGALLAPQLYFFGQHLLPGNELVNSPFHRYVNRSLIVLALIGMWPLLHSLGAKSWREIGLSKPSDHFVTWTTSFALGFFSFASVATIVILARGRVVHDQITLGKFLKGIFEAVLTALTVSLVEEILFRGAIFGALRRIWNWKFALLISSMIYAIFHFMVSARAEGPIVWYSGLEVLPRMLSGFGNLEVVIPGFFNLTIAGILLGFAYQKTGNLYFSIGLHAGWVFWLKAYGTLTSTVAGAHLWLWGTHKMSDGWLSLAVLVITFFVLIRLLQPQPAKVLA